MDLQLLLGLQMQMVARNRQPRTADHLGLGSLYRHRLGQSWMGPKSGT
jgi:hypothetical protein